MAGHSLQAAQLDLDFLYDPDPGQREANITAAIAYLTQAKVNTVFLQAHADDAGTGNIEKVYFYTSHAPVKADMFGYVTERLQGAGFRVYAWLSTLSGQWLLTGHPEDEVLAVAPENKGWYRRATPFSSRVRQELRQLAGDLAAHSGIDGILFNDDLYFNDFEDFSPAAKAAFKVKFGRELTPGAVSDPILREEWTKVKTQTLNDLTMELAAEIKRYRPAAKIARNIYAPLILDAASREWFAQDFSQYLTLYDYTVIMAYPRMEKAQNPEAWLQTLAKTAANQPQSVDKVIFKLQSYDWDSQAWLTEKELTSQVRALKAGGAVHLAYYPVNVFSNNPETLPF